MKSLLLLSLLVASATTTLFGQSNTVKTPPCTEGWCIDMKFSYRFCDQFGHMVEKCSSNPNNDKDYSPPLRPAKKATPLCLRGDYSSLPFRQIIIDPSTDTLDGSNVVVFDVFDMQGIVARAEREWTWLCPAQGPNNEYNFCCVTVKFSDEFTRFGSLPKDGTRAFTLDPPMNYVGKENYCRTDCQGSVIIINTEDEFTLPRDNLVPRRFFFTRDPQGAQALDPELQYASMHSIILHELGHWLGLGHSGNDQYGHYCGRTGSIMEPGYTGQWNWVDRGLTPEDVCAYMKLYCCDTTADALAVEEIAAVVNSRTFQVLPNPARSGSVRLRLSSALRGHALSVRLLNGLGQVALEMAVSHEDEEPVIDIAGLAGGAYFVQVVHDRGMVGEKMVVER